MNLNRASSLQEENKNILEISYRFGFLLQTSGISASDESSDFYLTGNFGLK